MQTILVVEDNEMNRDMLSRRLQRKGYEILNAANSHDVVEVLADQSPDLILMDIGLPGKDGHQVARELKNTPATAGIPIIALTAHAMVGDREKALAAGCDDYDTKPIDMPRLLAKITASLGSLPREN